MVNRLWRLWRRRGSSSWFRPRSLDSCGAGFNPIIAQRCVDAGSGSLGCAQLFWNSTRRQRRPCVSDETRGPLILGKDLVRAFELRTKQKSSPPEYRLDFCLPERPQAGHGNKKMSPAPPHSGKRWKTDLCRLNCPF